VILGKGKEATGLPKAQRKLTAFVPAPLWALAPDLPDRPRGYFPDIRDMN